MSSIDTTASTGLSDGSDRVAPDSGLLSRPPIDDECVWVSQHRAGWQEGEQGVILAVISHLLPHIPDEQKHVVEFGAGDASESLPLTCAPILGLPDFGALLIDSNPRSVSRLSKRVNGPKITTVEAEVNIKPDSDNNIDGLMASWGAPANPALMVVDVDSIDYHIVEGMKSRPIVLCVETLDMNSPQHKEHESKPYIPSHEEAGRIFDDDFAAANQANTAAFDALLSGRGYVLVFRTRFNSVYVRGDMAVKLRKKKLNLGAGPTRFPGYQTLDIKTGTDIRKPLDFPDGTFDEVYLSHVFEHVPREERMIVLGEVHRILKPYGTIRVAVPDFTKIARQVLKEEPDFPWNYLESVVYGGKQDANDKHDSMYREADLRDMLYKAGFGSVQAFEPFMDDTTRHPLSLNLEGRKRFFPKVESPVIALVLSQPRFTFSGHEEKLIKLASNLSKDLQLEVQPAVGAFWDRDMTIGTQAAINQYDPDYMLYSDYDSVFDPADVRTLLEAIQNDPYMAAIGSVQMSRHDDLPLVMEPGIDYTTKVSRVRFQHFGLTIVRREAFEELGQPWFWSVPGRDAKGNFDWQAWGRTDADITFWRNLDTIGLRVYQHNEVVIGHIIETVKYPKKHGSGVALVPIENVRRYGKPPEVGFTPDVYAERLAKKHGIPYEKPKDGK